MITEFQKQGMQSSTIVRPQKKPKLQKSEENKKDQNLEKALVDLMRYQGFKNQQTASTVIQKNCHITRYFSSKPNTSALVGN